MHKGSRARGIRKHSHSEDYGKNVRKKASREDERSEERRVGKECER